MISSDRAVTLSMGAYWRRIMADCLEEERAAYDRRTSTGNTSLFVHVQWYDEYHGSLFCRSERRIASSTWEAAEPPQGLCLPTDGSDLAEWRFNLAGRIEGIGKVNYNEVVSRGQTQFDGGFVTRGTMNLFTEKILTEQQNKDLIAVQKIAFAVLPDDCSVVAARQPTV